MWPVVKTVFLWAATVFLVFFACGGFWDGEPVPASFVLVVALMAYPPLWRYPPFGLTKVPAHVRWTIAIIAIIGYAQTLNDKEDAQPSKPAAHVAHAPAKHP